MGQPLRRRKARDQGGRVQRARGTAPTRVPSARSTGGTRPWGGRGGARGGAPHRAPPRDPGTTWSRFSAVAPQYWQVHSSRANTARRVSGACERCGIFTKARRRRTEGASTCRCSDRKTCPLETRTSAFSFSTRIHARLAAPTESGWCDALSTSARPTARSIRALSACTVPEMLATAESQGCNPPGGGGGSRSKDAWKSEQGAARGVRQRVQPPPLPYARVRRLPSWRRATRGRTIWEPSTKAESRASMQQMERPWSLAQQVDAEAIAQPLTFEDLFADQHERLYRALYLIVGNTHEAEELMQDAFVKVLERWDRIDNPAGYLYRSALNATRSRFRRLQRAAKRPLGAAEPEAPFAAADLRDHVVRSLRELPERQRAALVLVDLLDLRSEEAAKLLLATPPHVRSLASHARAALKPSMEDHDEE